MPLWTFKVFLAMNLMGLAYGGILFLFGKGAWHPIFEKDKVIRREISRRMGLTFFLLFVIFTGISAGVCLQGWKATHIRALLLLEMGLCWIVQKYYAYQAARIWEKRRGFYHNAARQKLTSAHLVHLVLLLFLLTFVFLILSCPLCLFSAGAMLLFFLFFGCKLERGSFFLFLKIFTLAFVFILLAAGAEAPSAFALLPLALLLYLF
ncbi:MAG TPA: hypothetical protein ENN72_04565 [Firmicutes bacterium]|nr:hypothetical protein [Bacillota bacterium]